MMVLDTHIWVNWMLGGEARTLAVNSAAAAKKGGLYANTR